MGDNYFKEWYKENRSKLSEARKTKYHTDDEYRQQAIQRARTYRRNKPCEIKPHTNLSINGVMTPVFTVGSLALHLSVSDTAIKGWERKNLIPTTPYKTKGGIRLFTERQMDVIKDELSKRGGRAKSNTNLKEDIEKRWV